MKIWQPLEAKTTLFEASAFRLTVILFGSIALSYAVLNFLGSTAPESPVLSSAYFDYLFQQLSQPVLIGGISLPLLGLIASHLRSIQTKKQIETQAEQIQTQTEQNLFSNYSKHREIFTEFFKDEKLFSGESGLSGRAHEIHALLYPDAKEGPLSPSDKAIENFSKVKESTESLVHQCKKTGWKTEETPAELESAIDIHTKLLCDSFRLKERFFNEERKLSSATSRMSRLMVTHKDLCSAATFFSVNECSRQFEVMHDNLSSAVDHLREVLDDQFHLSEILDHIEKTPCQPLSDFLKSKLGKVLSTDTDQKFEMIRKAAYQNHPNPKEKLEEIRNIIG